MQTLTIEQRRGDSVESVHRVSVAVVTADGKLRATAGDPDFASFVRSAAKPFQLLTMMRTGAADRFGMLDEEVALACASHNSEVWQVRHVAAFLQRLDLAESDLACGPHPSLFRDLGRYQGRGFVAPDLCEPSHLASNCSGKHTAMLAFARDRGWDTAGYQEREHPVQQAILADFSEWTGLASDRIGIAVDGCGVATFALPLRNMAQAFARLVASDGAHERRVVKAMMTHPGLIAGAARLCTAVMEAFPGKLVAKVGAGGIYLAGLPEEGLGIALKVEDGEARAAEVALLAVLQGLGLEPDPVDTLPWFSDQKVLNTRGEIVGGFVASGRIALR